MWFSCVWTRLGALGIQGNTGEVGYDSHPSIFGMFIRFFDYLMLNYRDFRRFSHA
jgi:hypothetical protein